MRRQERVDDARARRSPQGFSRRALFTPGGRGAGDEVDRRRARWLDEIACEVGLLTKDPHLDGAGRDEVSVVLLEVSAEVVTAAGAVGLELPPGARDASARAFLADARNLRALVSEYGTSAGPTSES